MSSSRPRRNNTSGFPTPSLYDQFLRSLARKTERMARWTSRSARNRQFHLEALERRLLLSADAPLLEVEATYLIDGTDTAPLVMSEMLEDAGDSSSDSPEMKRLAKPYFIPRRAMASVMFFFEESQKMKLRMSMMKFSVFSRQSQHPARGGA